MKKNNIKYDWVILTNPQMEPQNNIDNLTLLDNEFMYSPGYKIYGGVIIILFLWVILNYMNYILTM